MRSDQKDHESHQLPVTYLCVTLDQTTSPSENIHVSDPVIHPIVVYIIDRHPLEPTDPEESFRWLHIDNDFKRDLQGLIGPFDEDQLSILIDDAPAGEKWDLLLGSLLDEEVNYLVTHLAPLSSAQRQQLIGICAQVGTQLITPGDAGRSRVKED